MRVGLSALGVSVLLSGCVSSQETFTASGEKGHSITCTPAWTGGVVGAVASASTSWAQCYQKAGELCGARGYDIIQQVGEGGVYGQAGQGGGFVSSTNNRMMIVKCKDGGAPPTTASTR